MKPEVGSPTYEVFSHARALLKELSKEIPPYMKIFKSNFHHATLRSSHAGPLRTLFVFSKFTDISLPLSKLELPYSKQAWFMLLFYVMPILHNTHIIPLISQQHKY